VPADLDEVAFGSAWNKKMRMEVAADLKVPDYATNRGGPSTLEWSNLYWANRLASGLSAQKKIVAISISGEGTKGQFLPTFSKNLQLVRPPVNCNLLLLFATVRSSLSW
jgi:hypothetical protein